jgi:hypothetical protein
MSEANPAGPAKELVCRVCVNLGNLPGKLGSRANRGRPGAFRGTQGYANVDHGSIVLIQRLEAEMVNHIVLLTFKLGHASQFQPLMKALAALRSKLPGMTGISGGPYDSPEGFNQGYTHGLIITFADAASRNQYLGHPDHEKVKADFLPLVEKVVAFDYTA